MNEIDLIEELDDKTKLLILKMQKELKSKDAEINELKNQLAFLKNQLLNKNRKLFGKSSEQANENQMSFFNEAEKNSDTRVPEPELEEISYTRKKPSSYTGKKDNLSTLERVVIEHKLDEAEAELTKGIENITNYDGIFSDIYNTWSDDDFVYVNSKWCEKESTSPYSDGGINNKYIICSHHKNNKKKDTLQFIIKRNPTCNKQNTLIP